jgi:hypothetical protein
MSGSSVRIRSATAGACSLVAAALSVVKISLSYDTND